MAIFHDGYWVPVQVKSSYGEAQKAIPYGGISVYPEHQPGKNPEFYYFFDKKTRPLKFEEFLK
jgi:hypothetical protein